MAQQEIAAEVPFRVHYLVSYEHTDDESQHRTETCRPLFHTRAAR